MIERALFSKFAWMDTYKLFTRERERERKRNSVDVMRGADTRSERLLDKKLIANSVSGRRVCVCNACVCVVSVRM